MGLHGVIEVLLRITDHGTTGRVEGPSLPVNVNSQVTVGVDLHDLSFLPQGLVDIRNCVILHIMVITWLVSQYHPQTRTKTIPSYFLLLISITNVLCIIRKSALRYGFVLSYEYIHIYSI